MGGDHYGLRPINFVWRFTDMTYKRKGRQERGSTRRIITRVSEEEFEEWHRRAELLGITLSEYLRQCVRNGKVDVIIKKEISIEPLVQIAAEYGKIGSNINQIAHYLNSTGVWSQRLLDNLTGNLQEMYVTTKRLAKVVDEINGNYKAQSNEKFRL